MSFNSSIVARLRDIHIAGASSPYRDPSQRVHPDHIAAIVCHRLRHEKNEFLVKWGSGRAGNENVYSWHILPELEHCLFAVQEYVDQQPLEASSDEDTTPTATLPTQEMLAEAAASPILLDTHRVIRQSFLERLSKVKDLWLENNIDAATPSLRFEFIEENIITNDAAVAMAQNQAVNKPKHQQDDCSTTCGSNCRYTKDCSCMQATAAVNNLIDCAVRPLHGAEMSSGSDASRTGIPKRWPFSRAKAPIVSQLRSGIVKLRQVVLECNSKCGCGPACRNRRVSNGRKVPLTIFKTQNCGWGVFCSEELVKGEFIERYIGEVITDDESDRRETVSTVKTTYCYSLDRFKGEDGGPVSDEDCLLIDAQHFGNVSRFINHSCNPNLMTVCVMYSRHNKLLYDLALFAAKDINEGIELTFDYKDLDDAALDVVIAARQAALEDPDNAGQIRCNCGSPYCRGFIWI